MSAELFQAKGTWRHRRGSRSEKTSTSIHKADEQDDQNSGDDVDYDSEERLGFSSSAEPPKRFSSAKVSTPSKNRKPKRRFKKRSSIATPSSKKSGDQENGETYDEEETYEMEEPEVRTKMTSGALLMLDEPNGVPDTTVLLEQGVRDRNFFNITRYKLPTMRSEENEKEYEKLIYVPSTKPVPLEEKLPQQGGPRDLEDEGLFCGDPIPISSKNQNRLEQRLLKENGLIWFRQDGNLRSCPNPKRKHGIRIFYDDREEEEFKKKLIFVPAKLDPHRLLQLDSTRKYEVIVEISSISFKHHPFFSKEHILASKVEQKFLEYAKRRELGITERLKNKLNALREVLNHTKSLEMELRQKVEDGMGLSSDEENHMEQLEERIAKYQEEMKTTRSERDESLWNDRVSLISMLDTWKSLKALRQDQGYNSTSTKLNILTEQEDLAADREKWTKELNQEFEDLKEEAEIEYELNYSAYRAQLKDWQRHRGRVNERGDTDEIVEDDYSASEKPVEPVTVDPKKLREEISKRFRQLHRLPGEPKITLELGTVIVTPTDEMPKGSEKEETRRSCLESAKLKLRIVFNGREVYRTTARDLKSDFTATIGLSIPITIDEWPKTLQIHVWERNMLGKYFFGDLELKFPNSKTSIEDASLQQVEFKSEDIVKLSSNAGVGSGIGFEILGSEKQGIQTCGSAFVRVGWSKDEKGQLLCLNAVDDMLASGDPSAASSGYHEDSRLDPNDPNNARWLNMKVQADARPNVSDTANEVDVKKKDEFLLDDLMREFDFCTMEDINNSLRFQVLQLRDEGVPEFRNYRMVPPYDEDIPVNIFKSFGYTTGEIDRKDGETDTFEDAESTTLGIDFNRLDKIRQIRINVLKLFERASKQLTFEDLVVEEQIPDIGTLGLNLMSFFQPRRALRPERKERKQIHIGTSLLDASTISLIVNVVRATNLPMKRLESASLETLTTEAITGVSYFKKDITTGNIGISPVKPFVEVSFKRSHARTITSVGSNPIWNQELHISLPGLQSQSQQIEEDIYILIYDEVEVDILEDDRRRGTDIHQRLERRWLGYVTIPFSTLYLKGRIEGTFKVHSPSVLLGYETQLTGTGFLPSTPLEKGIPELKKTQDLSCGNQNQTFITFFATLQPAFVPSSIPKKISSSGESPEILGLVQAWESKILQKFPNRKLKALVMNSTGETLLTTRYLDSLAPPDSIAIDDEDANIMDVMGDLAHYVALFPTLRSSIETNDLSLWLTSDVFVETPGGGIDDHAILLACYFMYLDVPGWLVYGDTVLDGPSTFVLTSFRNIKKEDMKMKSMKNETFIWSPHTGECFNVNASCCPLQTVWCIIGKSNIWGNMSPYDLPQHVDWNFEKSAQWLPLFSKALPESKLPSLQISESIKYETPDKSAVTKLTQHIERNLKEAFMIWRKTSRTIWNRHCSSVLRRILPNLEQRKMGRFGPIEIQNPVESNPNLLFSPDSSIIDDPFVELKEILTSYQITGFPLQLPFVNMERITETVFATSLHSIDTPNVEFALAVFVKAYPANVFSVWIYLAALYKQK